MLCGFMLESVCGEEDHRVVALAETPHIPHIL